MRLPLPSYAPSVSRPVLSPNPISRPVLSLVYLCSVAASHYNTTVQYNTVQYNTTQYKVMGGISAPVMSVLHTLLLSATQADLRKEEEESAARYAREYWESLD